MASGGVSATASIPVNAPKWMKEAEKYLGVKEWVIKNKKKVSNPIVLDMFDIVGHGWVKNAITTPWCAAFVGAVLENCGYKSTKKLNARSYLLWGDEVKEPKLGDVVVLWRGKRDDGVTGHVFFFIKKVGNWIYGIGGNQGDSVTIQRFSTKKLLGYRRPRNILIKSKTIRAAVGSGVSATISETANQVNNTINSSSAIEAAKETINQIQEPVSTLGSYLPTITVIFAVITVTLALLAAYYRYKDYKETGL